MNNKIFFLVVLFAAVLRFYNIGSVPPSLGVDEVSHGFNAYSILKTGSDEWGEHFPLIFRAYGDYKLPAYIYSTAGSMAIFGLNAFAVRFPSVLAGIFIVAFAYLLGEKLFDKRIALFSAILVAVEPWSFFLSRIALEANLALAFVIAGVYFFLLGIEKAKFLPFSAVLFGLSVWTYNSARIFVPLFLAALIWLYREQIFSSLQKRRIYYVVCCMLFVVFFLPMFYQLAVPYGQARYEKVAILDEGTIHQINQARAESGLSTGFARLMHNKATYFIPRFFTNWLSHYRTDFLFLEGAKFGSYSVPGYGLLYIINLPFFLVGLILVFQKSLKRQKPYLLVFVWLLLAPLPASLTRESPHTLRAITMLPIPMIMTALGGWFVFDWLKNYRLNKVFLVVYFILLAAFVEGYLISYFKNYPKEYSQNWQYGYSQAVSYVEGVHNNYDKIIVTKKYGEPHEFFLFYWPWDPAKYRKDENLIRFAQSDWYWVDRFDKFYFVNDWEIPKVEDGEWRMESGGEILIEGQVLLITSEGNYPPGWQKLETINFLDGKVAFEILENTTKGTGK